MDANDDVILADQNLTLAIFYEVMVILNVAWLHSPSHLRKISLAQRKDAVGICRQRSRSRPSQTSFLLDIRTKYLDVVASCAPGLHTRLQSAKQQAPFIGGAIANFMRQPFGSGWALVGDAGLTMDPCTAAGINNAFRDADFLAEAVDDALAGRHSITEALATYHSRRDQASKPIYEFACQLAPFAPPSPEMIRLFGALASNPAETNRFLGLFAQTASPVDFFAPDNLQRIIGAALHA